MTRKNNVKKFYQELAKVYDKNRFGSPISLNIDKIHKAFIRDATNNFEIMYRPKILDIGCGTGRFSIFLYDSMNPDISISADTSTNMLQILLNKKNDRDIYVILADIENLPFRRNYFDIIICSQLLAHIHKYNRPIKEMKNVLKKNGIIIFDIRNSMNIEIFLSRILRPIRDILGKNKYYPHYTTYFTIRKLLHHLDLKIENIYGLNIIPLYPIINIKNIPKECSIIFERFEMILGTSRYSKLFGNSLIIVARLK